MFSSQGVFVRQVFFSKLLIKMSASSSMKLELDLFTLKDNGRNKSGGMNAFPLIKEEVICFNLTPDDWLQTPFGFSLDGKFETPSFLTGKHPEKSGMSEGLSLKVRLADPQVELLKKLDDTAHSAFSRFAEVKWNPLVTEAVKMDGKYNDKLCKFNVVLKGDGLTKIKIVDGGKVISGEGWEFLKELGYVNGSSAFKRAEVKAAIKVKKLWHVAGKAGLSLEATQLVLRVYKPSEVDVFCDEQLLK